MSTTIQMVEITNFRNIKHLVLGLKETVSIITGKNKLGKSNVLNAINWFITDTLLTDKYGTGENDIDSIVPITHLRGDHTEVKLTLSTGATYSKIYKVKYTPDGSKINGHTTEYKRNGVSVGTQKAFYDELYEVFGFKPAFTSLKINEVRLMTNPLYALLILDSKELRKLLVAMGCSVSNEELYQMGFEYMRPLEAQYGGRWDDVRLNAKDRLKQAKAAFDNHTAQLGLFNMIEEPDLEILEKLKTKRDKLVEKRTILNTTSVSEEITELEQQIKEVTFDEHQRLVKRNDEIDIQIMEIQNKIDNVEKVDAEAYELATKGIKEQIAKVKDELLKINDNYSKVLNEKMGHITDKNLKLSEKKYHENNVAELSDKLAHLLNPENEIECPCCGYKFVHLKDNNNESLDDLKAHIEQEQNLIDVANSDVERLESLINTINARLELATTEKMNKNIELSTLEKQLADYPRQHTSVEDLRIEKYQLEVLKTKNLDDSKLPELKAKRDNLVNNARETRNADIQAINDEIIKVDELISKESIRVNDWERKENLQKLIGTDQQAINEAEAWLGQVNKFIFTMIKMINQRAKEITGFDFVMLEENLTNGNLVEVCYALIDGVPFKDLNTADKFKYGIKFLEVCRRIAANKTGLENSLPILGDRFESISSVETIKSYTTSQLICTRVNECEEMRVE